LKIAICGDLHFGIKDSSFNAFKYQKRFFEEYLIPITKEYKCEKLVFLGDILHSRRNINLRILSEITRLFKQIQTNLSETELLGVVGNHDLYFRNSYDIAAVKDLDLGLNYGNNKYYIIDNNLFIHWHNTKEELQETIREIISQNLHLNIEYIYGHFAFFGFKLNSCVANTNDEDIEDSFIHDSFPNLRYVFSGHFHSPSEKGKVKYVGVPYQLTWAELNDELGFYILDTDTNELTFFKNKYKAFELIKMDKVNLVDDIVNMIEECEYRKLYKIYYRGGEREAVARYLYNQILLKNHDVQMIDESIYIDDNEVEMIKDSELVSIETLIRNYFMADSNCIPEEERDGYYNIFKAVYERVKTQSDSVEI